MTILHGPLRWPEANTRLKLCNVQGLALWHPRTLRNATQGLTSLYWIHHQRNQQFPRIEQGRVQVASAMRLTEARVNRRKTSLDIVRSSQSQGNNQTRKLKQTLRWAFPSIPYQNANRDIRSWVWVNGCENLGEADSKSRDTSYPPFVLADELRRAIFLWRIV